MSFKKLIKVCSFILILIISNQNILLSEEPEKFIESIVDEASRVLAENVNKEEKIEKLKLIAKKSVDIKALGFYTLGNYRKTISEEHKIEYSELFEKYFLKTFSSRLSDYTDPKIIVISQHKINEKYTIVSSVLIATKKRPEIKIDWRVYNKNVDKPLIRDLIIEGLSLAKATRGEFKSIIDSNDGNIVALFDVLKNFINK